MFFHRGANRKAYSYYELGLTRIILDLKRWRKLTKARFKVFPENSSEAKQGLVKFAWQGVDQRRVLAWCGPIEGKPDTFHIVLLLSRIKEDAARAGIPLQTKIAEAIAHETRHMEQYMGCVWKEVKIGSRRNFDWATRVHFRADEEDAQRFTSLARRNLDWLSIVTVEELPSEQDKWLMSWAKILSKILIS